MINQPWKSRNWFTFTVIFDPKDFSNSDNTVYYPTKKKQTINLTDVQGWLIIPSNGRNRKHGPPEPDLCKVTLASGIKINLHSGTINTLNQKMLSPTQGTMKIDQITDFLDAMRAANL